MTERFRNIERSFARERERILEECIACGACAEICPASTAALPGMDPAELQREFYAFLENPAEKETAKARSMSCMECFGCLEVCPQGLNPMRAMLIARSLLVEKNLAAAVLNAPKESGSRHRRALAELPEQERRKALDPTPKREARFVLFPGCNAYIRPELVLAMQKVMDRVAGNDWAFVPGLADCCGGWRLSSGDWCDAEASYRRLLSRALLYRPETLILWCPTCLCNFKTVYRELGELKYEAKSFFQFLAERTGELEFRPVQARVTLHEPCKTAYTGLDTSHREVMAAIPGLELAEMPRHGADTVCCGSNMFETYPELAAEHMAGRLAEAEATGAETLLTVCHSCHDVMAGAGGPQPVENLLDIVARSLGIED